MLIYNYFALPAPTPANIALLVTGLSLILGVLSFAALCVIILGPYVPSWFTYVLGLILLSIIGAKCIDDPLWIAAYAIIGSSTALLADIYPFSEWTLQRVSRKIEHGRKDKAHELLANISQEMGAELVAREINLFHEERVRTYGWFKLRRFAISTFAILLTISYYVAAIHHYGIIGGAFLGANLLFPLILIMVGNPLSFLRNAVASIVGAKPSPEGWLTGCIGWIWLLGLMAGGEYLVENFLPALKQLL